jgi:hypothetical protein
MSNAADTTRRSRGPSFVDMVKAVDVGTLHDEPLIGCLGWP